VLVASAYSVCVLAATSVSPGALLGVWKEKDASTSGATVTYSFQKDHDFEIRPIYKDGSGRTESGAWQMGTDVCWIGDRGTKGNLMIHLGTDRCCHLVYFLGKNLILNNFGNSTTSYDVCADRVLVREK
jgi:hypothetical protein